MLRMALQESGDGDGGIHRADQFECRKPQCAGAQEPLDRAAVEREFEKKEEVRDDGDTAEFRITDFVEPGKGSDFGRKFLAQGDLGDEPA